MGLLGEPYAINQDVFCVYLNFFLSLHDNIIINNILQN